MQFGEGYVCIAHADEGTRLPSALLQPGYCVCIIKTKWSPKPNCLQCFPASDSQTKSKYRESQYSFIMVRANTLNETFMTDKDIIC